MKLPDILPPADLLEHIEGVEEGLRRGRRLGIVGWVGVVIWFFQAVVAFFNSDWLNQIRQFDFQQPLEHWPVLLSLAFLIISLLLINVTKFWVKESRRPFHYTCSIANFVPVESTPAENKMSWLRHDLTRELSKRVGRLSLLESATESKSETERESHIHVFGYYIIRLNDENEWSIELIPHIRIGPSDRPATLAHTVRFLLDSKPGDMTPPDLDIEEYEQILERVYFSIASEIYKQIRQDVQEKIDLLPTNRYRAAAYFYEAEDYARSRTLDGYEDAGRLYFEAMKLYDPTWRIPAPTTWGRFVWRMQVAASRLLRKLPAFLSNQNHAQLLAARAEIGYVNMLIYLSLLVSLSGGRTKPIYEARPVALSAVDRLNDLTSAVPGQPDALFDAHVSVSLVWALLGDNKAASDILNKARSLMSARAETDSRFQFSAGIIEARMQSKIYLFRSAAELDREFEIAHFFLAITSEYLWRISPQLERDVGKQIIAEYRIVVKLNPGNIGAWANIGYMYWLLGNMKEKDFDKAEEAFKRGRDYKEIKHETFVAEIDYGLARLSAELGECSQAYENFLNAYSAEIYQGYAHGGEMAKSNYYYYPISRAMQNRYEYYKDRVEKNLNEQECHKNSSPRILNALRAFILNDFGEACYSYYLHSYNYHYWEEARRVYLAAKTANPNYVIPCYNLFIMDRDEEYLKDLIRIEPEWSAGKLAFIEHVAETQENQLRDAALAREKAEQLKQEAVEKRLQLDELRERSIAPKSRLVPAGKESKSGEMEPPSAPVYTVTNVRVGKSERGTDEHLEKRSENINLPSMSTGPETDFQRNDLRTQLSILENEVLEIEQAVKNEENEAKALTDKAVQNLDKAQKLLSTLVPHEWLWKSSKGDLGVEINWQAFNLKKYTEELKWERGFNESQVRALFAWSKVQKGWDNTKTFDRTKILLHHIEKHFWPDNFDLRRYRIIDLNGSGAPDSVDRAHLRDMVEQNYKSTLAYWSLSWFPEQTLFDDDECIAKFKTVVDHLIANSSDQSFLLQWLGDQLEQRGALDYTGKAYRAAILTEDQRSLFALGSNFIEKGQRDFALETFRKAADQANSPVQLVQIAEAFEKLNSWTEGLGAYQKAMAHEAYQPNVHQPVAFYQSRIVRALIQLNRWDEAVQELEKIPLPYLLEDHWWLGLVYYLGNNIRTQEHYRKLRVLLEDQKELALQKESHAASVEINKAILSLIQTRSNIANLLAVPDSESSKLLPVVTPIVLEAEATLFPAGNDWWEDHPMFKLYAPAMRNRIKDRMGINVPGVRVRANEFDLPASSYIISLDEVPIVLGTVQPGKQFFGQVVENASPHFNPLTGDQDGCWLEPGLLANIEGETIDIFEYMIRHVEYILLRNLPQFLGHQEMVDLLADSMTEWETNEVKALLDNELSQPDVQQSLLQVLRGLLLEGVPITDLQSIIISFAKSYRQSSDLQDTIEGVRHTLRHMLPGQSGDRQFIDLSPAFESHIKNNIREICGKYFLAIAPEDTQDLLSAVRGCLGERPARHFTLVSRQSGLRPYIRRLVEIEFPDLIVLDWMELPDDLVSIDETLIYKPAQLRK